MTDKDKSAPKGATTYPAETKKEPNAAPHMRGGYGDHTSHDDRDAKSAYPDATGMPARNADYSKATSGGATSAGSLGRGSLAGMAFATFDKDGKLSHTGLVDGWVMPDRYVVRYLDAEGKPGAMKMVEGKQLTSSDINETRPNTVELFENEGALKAWLESDEAKAATKPA